MKIRDRIKEFRRVKASELEPHPKNWRKHPDSQADAMRGILADVGYVDALIAYERDNGRLRLIDGHLRAEITPDTEVPILILDVNDEEADLILATFDPLSAMADADSERLEELLAEIETGSEALQTMLDELAEEAGIEVEEPEIVDPEPQIDRAAELQEQWGTERGQLWEITGPSGMVHRLLCGDSTDAGDVERVMGGERAGVMMTDPPYGISVVGSSGKIGGSVLAKNQTYAPVIGDDVDYDPSPLFVWASRFVLWGANYYCNRLPSRGQWIVWDKGRPEGTTFSDAELAWTDGDGVAIKMFRCVWHGMIREGESGDRVHPTQKPVKLIVDILRQIPCEVVADFFLGSGTTMVAAEQLSRRCFGIEISAAYTAVVLERMTALDCKCEVQP